MKKLMMLGLMLSGCAGAPELIVQAPMVISDAGAPVVVEEPPVKRANHFAAVRQITCGMYCHGNVTDFVGRMSEKAPSRALVIPGKPAESYLMLKLLGTHVNLPECAGTPSPCGKKMPAAGEISSADLEAIRAWIEEGAPMSSDN